MSFEDDYDDEFEDEEQETNEKLLENYIYSRNDVELTEKHISELKNENAPKLDIQIYESILKTKIKTHEKRRRDLFESRLEKENDFYYCKKRRELTISSTQKTLSVI